MARILVVDDSTMIRELVRMVLEYAGHEVVEAEDGDVALAMDLGGFKLVLTDLYMPRVSGFEVIRAAVAAKVAVLAFSGGDRLSGEDPLAVALALGARLALRKPFAAVQLIRGVTECLEAASPNPRVIEYVSQQRA